MKLSSISLTNVIIFSFSSIVALPSYAETPAGVQLSVGATFSKLAPNTSIDFEDSTGQGVMFSSRTSFANHYIFDFNINTLGSATLSQERKIDYQSVDIGVGRRFSYNAKTDITARAFVGQLSVNGDQRLNVSVTHPIHAGFAAGFEYSLNEKHGVMAELISWDRDATALSLSYYQRF